MERMTPNIEKLFQQKLNNAESHSFSPELKTALQKKVEQMQQMKHSEYDGDQLQSDMSEAVAVSSKQGWNARLFEGAAGVKTIIIAGTLMLGLAAVFIVNAAAGDEAEENITESVVAPVFGGNDGFEDDKSISLPAEISEPDVVKTTAAALDKKVAAESKGTKVHLGEKLKAPAVKDVSDERLAVPSAPVGIEDEESPQTAAAKEPFAEVGNSDDADDFDDANAPEAVAEEIAQASSLDDEVANGQEQKADSAPVYIRKTHVEENVTVRLKKQKGRHAKRRNRK